MSHNKDIIIYDGECGICNMIIEWIKKRDKENKLDYLPNQMLENEISLRGLNKNDAIKSVILYCPQEKVIYKEARAVFEILRRLDGIWKLIGTIHSNPLSSAIARPFYRIIASNRNTLSQILGFNMCKRSLN